MQNECSSRKYQDEHQLVEAGGERDISWLIVAGLGSDRNGRAWQVVYRFLGDDGLQESALLVHVIW